MDRARRKAGFERSGHDRQFLHQAMFEEFGSRKESRRYKLNNHED